MRTIVCAIALASCANGAFAQSSPPLKFEVASIRPTPLERQNLLRPEYCTSGGRFAVGGTPVIWSLAYAFHLRDSQISGAPGWLSAFDSAYDIEAKPGAPATNEQCRQMVQSLFAERFKLAAHREMKESSVYLLTVAKNGPKLHAGGVKLNGAVMVDDSEKPISPDGWTMARLSGYLSDFVGRPVVDRTELEGTYGITLDFSLTDGDDRPNLFTAVQEQPGLKLEAGRALVETLAIDHIERPTAN